MAGETQGHAMRSCPRGVSAAPVRWMRIARPCDIAWLTTCAARVSPPGSSRGISNWQVTAEFWKDSPASRPATPPTRRQWRDGKE